MHRQKADEAYEIGEPGHPVRAYLDAELLVATAKKVGADPAVFSNPFISTFCDATGLIIYFTIATTVLGLS